MSIIAHVPKSVFEASPELQQAVNLALITGNLTKIEDKGDFTVHYYNSFSSEKFRKFFSLNEQGAYLEGFMGWIEVQSSELGNPVPKELPDAYKLDAEGNPTEELLTLEEWLRGTYYSDGTNAIFPAGTRPDAKGNKTASWSNLLVFVKTYGNADLSNVYNHKDGIARANEIVPPPAEPEGV